jgi:hypothetical protein
MGWRRARSRPGASSARPVRGALGVPDDEILISGMAMGHADWSAPQNTLVSEREPVEGFATFLTE